MLIHTAIAIVAVLVVVGLFVALFMQGAYVRYRLQDVEAGKVSYMSDLACPDVDNAVRSYAVKLALCKLTEMNLSSRLPEMPDDVYSSASCPSMMSSSSSNSSIIGQQPTSTAKRPIKAYWLVLRRTSTAKQLEQDVSAGRVKYIIASGILCRVASIELQTYFSETERTTTLRDFVFLAICDPLASLASQCSIAYTVMPWGQTIVREADDDPKQMLESLKKAGVAQHCNGSPEEARLDDVVLHIWGYGISTKASSE
jgi:hypothetical protein